MRRYQQPPQARVPTLKKLPQLTLRELVSSTAAADRNTASTVNLRNVTALKAPEALRRVGFTKLQRGITLTAENRHEHSVRVFYADQMLNPNSKVIVDCTCPRHAFYYEVANAARGASFIYRSNGDRPNITNPGMRVGCCKHAFRLLSYLLKEAGGGKPKGPGARVGRATGKR